MVSKFDYSMIDKLGKLFRAHSLTPFRVNFKLERLGVDRECDFDSSFYV